MGSGASAAIGAATSATTDADLKAALLGVTADNRNKLAKALANLDIIKCSPDEPETILAVCKLGLPEWSSVTLESFLFEKITGGVSGQAVIKAVVAGKRPEEVIVKLSNASSAAPAPKQNGLPDIADAASKAFATKGLVAKTYLAGDLRAPGVLIIEYLGKTLHFHAGPGWLNSVRIAEAVGKCVGFIHTTPEDWFKPYEEELEDGFKEGIIAGQLMKIWGVAILTAGTCQVTNADLNKVRPFLTKCGHFACDTYGAALALRKTCTPDGGDCAIWNARLEKMGKATLAPEERENICKLYDVIISVWEEAASTIPEGSLMWRLVVSHGDLHALNMCQHASGEIRIIDLDLVKRNPAAFDLGSSTAFSFYEPDKLYPSLQIRRALAGAYLEEIKAIALDFTRNSIDEVVFDTELNVVFRFLFAAVVLFFMKGARQPDSWGFLGIAKRSLAAWKAAEASASLRQDLLDKGLKPSIIGEDAPCPFISAGTDNMLAFNPRFWETEGAADKWLPEVTVVM